MFQKSMRDAENHWVEIERMEQEKSAKEARDAQAAARRGNQAILREKKIAETKEKEVEDILQINKKKEIRKIEAAIAHEQALEFWI